MRDWTGNKNSVFKNISATNHTVGDDQREQNDYYATDPNAINYLIAGGGVKYPTMYGK